jgi:hypothetical protein
MVVEARYGGGGGGGGGEAARAEIVKWREER